MKKLLLLLSLPFFIPQQKAAEVKNITFTAVVSAALTAGTVLAIQQGSQWYYQTATKKQIEQAQKEGDLLYDKLKEEYAHEINALYSEQLHRKKYLEIIQNKNHDNDPHPVRPYSHELNNDIKRLKRARFSEKQSEAQQLLDNLQRLRVIKNNTLQRDYESAQKAYREEKYENDKKNIELEKLRCEKEAARQHYQNEQHCSDILTNVDLKFESMLTQLEKQTNPIHEIREAIRDFVVFVGQRLGQIENKQERMHKNLQSLKEQSSDLKNLKKEMSDLSQKQREQNAMLGVVNEKINSLDKQEDPAYANASAPLYPDLYKE